MSNEYCSISVSIWSICKVIDFIKKDHSSVNVTNFKYFSMMEDEEDGEDSTRDPSVLNMQQRLEYKQDKTLYAAR